MEYIVNTDYKPAMYDIQSDKDVEKQVLSALMQNSKIEFCNIAVSGTRVIIGVIPYPLFSRSEREELSREVAKSVYALYDFDDVVVSFDTDVIYALSKDDITKECFDELFDSIINRRW